MIVTKIILTMQLTHGLRICGKQNRITTTYCHWYIWARHVAATKSMGIEDMPLKILQLFNKDQIIIDKVDSVAFHKTLYSFKSSI